MAASVAAQAAASVGDVHGSSAQTVIAAANTLSSLAARVYTVIPGGSIVVKYIRKSHQNDPQRTLLELLLFVFMLWYFGRKRSRPAAEGSIVKLTEREIDELCTEWEPEPLVRALTDFERAELAKTPVIVGPAGSKVRLQDGKDKINLASYAFIDMLNDERIKELAIQALHKYGVGTCGPRLFYGTVDVHLKLEEKFAKFVGTESSICYAQGFAAVSSIIPCFSKRGDVIIADENCNFALQKGLQVSKSLIKYYKHNDMKDLERILKETNAYYEKQRAPLNKRFVVTEGIFESSGGICDLQRIVELKEKYKYRLIIDESMSMGVVGHRMAGVTDLFAIDATRVDLIVFSLANAFASGGGMCCANSALIEHQRLASGAYTFSASLPAMLAITAIEVLDRLSVKNNDIGARLLENISVAHSALRKSLPSTVEIHPSSDDNEVGQISEENSPLINLYVAKNFIPSSAYPDIIASFRQDTDSLLKSPTPTIKALKQPELELSLFFEQEKILREIVDESIRNGVLIATSKYVIDQECKLQTPSIRICVTSGISKKEMERSATIIATAVKKVMKSKKY